MLADAAPMPGAPDMLIVLSHLRWDFVYQRPQHLISRAAKTMRVFFIEEPIREGERFEARRFERGALSVVQPVVPADCDDGALIQAHERRVVEAFAEGAGRLIVWVYTPMALPLIEGLAPHAIVFDKMDELAAFAFAPPELVAREAALMACADVVFTGGRAMFEAAAGRSANLHCFPSSIDRAHFAAARAGALPDPADQAGVGGPRIGFFGVIDERFDQPLLAEVAALRLDWQFVMLGPTAKIDPAGLPRAGNIHWLGGKSYDDLPAYLAHWNAGWMPFALNDSTRFISPTKTPEYLAAGLPVVSTPITDVVRPYGAEGLVEIAATAEETVAALERALRPRRPGWAAAVDAKLAEGSWDATWDAMCALIDKALVAKAENREFAHV